MKKLILVFFLLTGAQARAYLTSDWDISLGTTSLSYSMGDLSDSLESATSIEVNYGINSSTLNSALILTFNELLGSGGQQIPFTRISAGLRYYFLGLNGQRWIYDSRSEAKIWRPTPFVGFSLGLSNLSVDSFNASFLDTSLRGGVEIPIAADTLLIGQVAIGSSLSSSGEVDTAVGYQSFSLFAGIRFAAFE